MARNPDYQLMYDTYQKFAQLCLIEDRSLLWPDRNLWTPSNVSELKTILIDSPELGNESFEEKLVKQMSGKPKELWGLLADTYFLYCIVPVTRSFKAATKQSGVENMAMQAQLPILDRNDPVWKALDIGFCASGMRYLQKYREFWLILLFAEQVKQAADREKLLKDRQAMQKTLDDCLESILTKADRGSDMRHAVLYLAFPDYYMRSISTTDKQKVIEVFGDRLPGLIPKDIDEAIFQIRQELEKDETMPVPLDFYNVRVKPLWKNKPRPISTPSVIKPEVQVLEPVGQALEMLSLFNFTRNVILYGPPGTGKTYIANLAAQKLVEKQLQAPVPEIVRLQNIAENTTFYDLLALGMYLTGKDVQLTVKEILELPLVQARFVVRPVKNEKESIWGYLQSHTVPESATVKVSYKAAPYLFDKSENSRWFLTPMGWEYVEQTLGDSLEELRLPVKEVGRAEDYIVRVAFHQSYAYEDFVEGFRPTGANEIEIVPGMFRQICAQAAGNPDASYVLIIDEINRGNISKIFGELISLLEDDKRDGQPAAFPIELAYSHLKFKVPGNLYVIGTMNTADRSIALLDIALRRRFAFYELLPDPSLLHGRVIQSDEGDAVDLERLLVSLNQRIYKELGSDYQIGHSYFLRVNTVEVLEFVWNNQVLPLLREYFYSQPERLTDVLELYLKEQEDEGDLRREGSDLIVALSELAK